MATTSIEHVLNLLNVGGWKLSLKGASVPTSPQNVTRVEIVDGEFVVRNGDLVLFHLSMEELSAEIKGDRVEATGDLLPRHIAIRGPFMVTQQRKKIEGGGWHEVKQVGTRCSFTHTAAQAQYDADKLAQRRKEEWAREEAKQARLEEEKREKERAEAEHARHIAEYVSRQQAKLQGRKLVELRIDNDVHSVDLVFEGGIEIAVVLCDREDIFDAHEEATLAIVIAGEQL